MGSVTLVAQEIVQKKKRGGEGDCPQTATPVRSAPGPGDVLARLGVDLVQEGLQLVGSGAVVPRLDGSQGRVELRVQACGGPMLEPHGVLQLCQYLDRLGWGEDVELGAPRARTIVGVSRVRRADRLLRSGLRTGGPGVPSARPGVLAAAQDDGAKGSRGAVVVDGGGERDEGLRPPELRHR